MDGTGITTWRYIRSVSRNIAQDGVLDSLKQEFFSLRVRMLTRNTSVRVVPESTPAAATRVQPVNQRFGERLRFLRRASNMTQVQLSAYLGIDRSFLSDVERGRKGMSLNFLDAVAKGFKISLSELLQDL